MPDFASYRADLREIVNTVWPEVDRDAGGGGIWTVARIELVALEDLRDDEQIATTAIIQPMPALMQPERTGIGNQVYSIETMFHYVRRRDMTLDLEEFCEARLQALASYLLDTGLPLHGFQPLGQCIDVLGIDATEANPANLILLEKNKAYFAASLTALMEVGDSPA